MFNFIYFLSAITSIVWFGIYYYLNILFIALFYTVFLIVLYDSFIDFCFAPNTYSLVYFVECRAVRSIFRFLLFLIVFYAISIYGNDKLVVNSSTALASVCRCCGACVRPFKTDCSNMIAVISMVLAMEKKINF